MKKKTGKFTINLDDVAPSYEPVTFESTNDDGSVYTIDPLPDDKLLKIPSRMKGYYLPIDLYRYYKLSELTLVLESTDDNSKLFKTNDGKNIKAVPCNCACHLPDVTMMHFVACCESGWKYYEYYEYISKL